MCGFPRVFYLCFISQVADPNVDGTVAVKDVDVVVNQISLSEVRNFLNEEIATGVRAVEQARLKTREYLHLLESVISLMATKSGPGLIWLVAFIELFSIFSIKFVLDDLIAEFDFFRN